MPKSCTNNNVPKPPELEAAEQAGKEALRRYCRDRQGRAADIARKTAILPPVLSKMANKGTYINLEAAVLIEVATEGVLRAEVLCPARAGLLADLLALRAGEAVEA